MNHFTYSLAVIGGFVLIGALPLIVEAVKEWYKTLVHSIKH